MRRRLQRGEGNLCPPVRHGLARLRGVALKPRSRGGPRRAGGNESGRPYRLGAPRSLLLSYGSNDLEATSWRRYPGSTIPLRKRVRCFRRNGCLVQPLPALTAPAPLEDSNHPPRPRQSRHRWPLCADDVADDAVDARTVAAACTHARHTHTPTPRAHSHDDTRAAHVYAGRIARTTLRRAVRLLWHTQHVAAVCCVRGHGRPRAAPPWAFWGPCALARLHQRPKHTTNYQAPPPTHTANTPRSVRQRVVTVRAGPMI